MDAVIRFCFNKEPEELDVDEYVKLYSQGKWILDYQNLMITEKAINSAL